MADSAEKRDAGGSLRRIAGSGEGLDRLIHAGEVAGASGLERRVATGHHDGCGGALPVEPADVLARLSSRLAGDGARRYR